jgi:WD40 repeat protein
MIAMAPMSVVEVWPEEIVRDGHKSAAKRVAFSPDGRLLATSGMDGQVIIWDFARRERVETIGVHADMAGALAFSPDGKWLVTGGDSHRLIVWDTAQWRKIREFHFQQGNVPVASFSPDGSLLAASISHDSFTLLWRPSDWAEVGRIPAAAGMAENLLFTPDGRRLIFGDSAWDVATGKRVGPLLNGEWVSNRGALSPDGALLVSVGSGGMVNFIDPARGRLLSRQRAHNFFSRGAAFSPDGRLVATGSSDIVLWDTATRTLLARLEHTDNVWGMSFSPDGRWLVSTHGDGAILLWDVAERRRAADFSGHSGPVRKVIFSPDGKSLVSGGDDQSAIIWDRASLRKQAVLTGHEASVRGLVFPAQPGLVATADAMATVRFWDIARRQPQESSPRLRTPEGIEYMLTGVALPPDLRWNVTALAVYERASGRMVSDNRVVVGNGVGFATAAFSQDGQRLIGIGTNGPVSLLESGTWRVLAHRQATGMKAIRVCFSPDDELLAIGDSNGQVWLWSVDPLQPLAELGRHETHVEAVVFSPDGRRVASASDDRTIRLWDVGGRKLVTRIGTHTSPINSIAFSPDGRQLLSGEHDGTVRLYTRHRTLWGFRLD